jgi:uncharacterized YccA/Bax inhibitor family protein
MANPALSNNPAFRRPSAATAAELEALFQRPAATNGDIGRMTYEDTAVKTVVLFAVLLAGAAAGWFVPLLILPGIVGGLVLGLVNAFKRTPSVPLIVAYAALEGMAIGGISQFFDRLFAGVVVEAVLATFITFAVTLALFASGRIRASARATRIFLIGIVAYFAFRILEWVLALTGVTSGQFGASSTTISVFGVGVPLGIAVGVLAVLLAAYALVLDFDMIQQGVRNGAPAKYGWFGAYSLMVTLVWLYLEFLRIFGLGRSISSS